ncbi:MAG: hypothetical protein PF904_09185 [Kiritimatiellae bacterium]|jgi:hypothetical protein|nr:hypothetical protein [Kiritimatiellia bacterium]
MKTTNHTTTIKIPSDCDFLKKYPRYTKIVQGHGRILFDLIMQPENALLAQHAARFKLPSVIAVADACKELAEREKSITLDPFTKQFIGAAICSLMETNGYRKTGTKKSVPHESFTVGEFYVFCDSNSSI